MANNDFETSLILRGKDLASQPIEVVVATVGKLIASLEKQTTAADAGAGSMAALGAASSEATVGFKALAAIQADVEKFTAALKKSEESSKALEQARAALEAFKDSLPAAKQRTDAQKDALAQLTDRVKQLNSANASAERTIKTVSDRLARNGIDAKNAATANQQLAESLQAIGTRLDRSTESFANFATNQNRARDAAKAQAAAVREQEKALEDLDRQIKKIEEDTAEAARRKQASDQAELDMLLKQLDAELKRTEQEKERRDAEAAAVVKQADRGAAAVRAIPTVAPVGSGQAQQQFDQAAQGIANILNPAAEARATLAGLESEIARLDGEFSKGKLSAEEYATGIRSARAAAEALGIQAGKIDDFNAQQAATVRASEAFEREKVTLQQLATQLQNAGKLDADLERQVKAQAATVQRAAEAFTLENNRLATLSAGLQKSGVDVRNLAAEEARLQAAAISLTTAMDKMQKVEGGHGAGLFNFNSPEIREAVATVRHLTDQIANGASVTQALESHIGNFVQLGLQHLPEVSAAVGLVAGGLAAMAVAAAAAVRAFEVSESTRKFNSDLQLSVDQLDTTGAALTETAKQIERLGVSFKDSQTVIRQFMDVGLDPSRMLEFAEVTRKLADVQQVSLVEANKKATEAFAGGARELIEYLASLHALTPAIEQEIRATQESNGLNAAREVAFRALKDATDRVTDAVNPLTSATRGLNNAWHDMLDYLGPAVEAVASAVVNSLGFILRAVNGTIHALSLIPGAANDASAKVRMNDAQQKISDANQIIAAASQMQPGAERDETIRQANEVLSANQKILDTLKQQTGQVAAQGDKAQGLIDKTQTLAAKEEAFRRERQIREDEENLRRERDTTKRAALQDRLLKAYREQASDEYASRGFDPLDPANAAQINDEIAKRQRGLQLQNQGAPDAATQIRLQTAEANAVGKTGAARKAADEAIINLKVQLKEEEALKDGAGKTDEERAKLISDYRAGLESEAAARRAKEGAGAANKVAAAEDNAAKVILGAYEKINKADATNLEARLKGIDEEYAKYNLALDAAARRGATSVPGFGSIASARAQLGQAEQTEKDQATLEARLAGLKAIEGQAKAATAGVTDAARIGGDAMASAVQKAVDVTKALVPAIKTAADQAVLAARRVNAERPSPQSAEQLEQAQTAQAGGGASIVKSMATDLLKPAQDATKDREELIASARTLEQDGAITATEAQNRIKEAYDSTTATILASTKAVQSYLAEMQKAGIISPQQMQLMSAAAQKLGAETTYASDQAKQLAQTIQSSIENQAVHAFDQATAALAKFAEGHEKLKDLISNVGVAFGEMAAGILKDIAQIIIKQQIMNALGFGGKGGGGSGSGDSGGSGESPIMSLAKFLTGDDSKPTQGQSDASGGGGDGSSGGGLFGGSGGGGSGLGGLINQGASYGLKSLIGNSGGSSNVPSGLTAIFSGDSESAVAGSGGEGGGFFGSLFGGLGLGPGNAAPAAYNALPAGVAGPVLGQSAAGAGAAASGTAAAGSAASSGGGFFSWLASLFGSGGAAAGSGAASSIASVAAVAHQGGIVGGGNLPMRPVLIDPNTLANLPRFHTGGDIGGGLQPGEHMIVAQSGEQVRTQAQQAADAKAMANAQSSQGRPLRQVLVMDPKNVSQAMSGSHGEDVTITHIKNNASTVREMLK